MSPATLPQLVDINEAQPLTLDDQPLVDEVVEVLRKHNALQRFGLTLLHQHFHIADNEVLLETTDRDSRVQDIRPVKKDEIAGLDYKETSWRLDTGRAVMNCVCTYRDGKHTGTHQHNR